MACCMCLVAITVAVLVLARLFMKFTSGKCTFIPFLQGKVFLLTGATSGIGRETAQVLAKRGATLYIACRSPSRANVLIERLKKETDNADIHALTLDLSSLDSVRKCAADFLAKNVPLHCLINNAGIMQPHKRELTKDNLEKTMATNTFGPFLLTNLLLEKLKETAKESGHARIVSVASIAHKFVRNLDLSDVNYELGYPFGEAYCASKLGNMLFTNELSRKLQGTGVTANCLHPGCIHTNIMKHGTFPWYLLPLFHLGNQTLKTALEGAQTSLYLATSPDVEHVTGRYFADCAPEYTTLAAVDDKISAEFWDVCEKMTGVTLKQKE